LTILDVDWCHPARKRRTQKHQNSGSCAFAQDDRKNLRSSRGFTLIEILIVIVIISIISTVAVLSMRFNQNKQLEHLAKQIVNFTTLAEEEAILRPATLGLAISPRSFQFFEYSETQKKWLALSDANLGKHAIADTMEVTLKIQGQDVPLDGLPKIIISASGDLTPFEILIGKKNAAPFYRVIGKANGEVWSGYAADEP
jgi:general secretion pathway protein H